MELRKGQNDLWKLPIACKISSSCSKQHIGQSDRCVNDRMRERSLSVISFCNSLWQVWACPEVWRNPDIDAPQRKKPGVCKEYTCVTAPSAALFQKEMNYLGQWEPIVYWPRCDRLFGGSADSMFYSNKQKSLVSKRLVVLCLHSVRRHFAFLFRFNTSTILPKVIGFPESISIFQYPVLHFEDRPSLWNP